MSIKNKIFLLTAFLLFAFFKAGAQRNTIPQQQGGNDEGQALQKDREIVNQTTVDSINITTYELFDLHRQDTFKTKGLTKYFQQYDPARQSEFEYGNLGNMGSAAYPLVLSLDKQVGYRLGLTQYDLYHKTEKDIIFFKQNTPFSELYFSGGETQADLRMRALFSRPYANGVNFVIQYDRIAQQGIYEHQQVRQTSLLTSLAFKPRDKRYSTYINYTINASIEQVNGGVDNDTIYADPDFSIRAAIEPYIEDAENRLQNQTIKFDLFYELGNDTIESNFKNSIQYEANYFTEFYRYSDDEISADEEYYRNFFVDERGVRSFIEQHRVRNSLFLNSRFGDIYKFKTGITYDFNILDLSAETRRFNEVYLRFSGGTNIGRRISLDVDAFYGLLSIANEFRLDARANLALTKKQGFNFGFRAGRYSNNFVQDRLFINEQLFYENQDIKKVLLQTLSAEYYNKSLGLRAGGRLQNTFNYTYFDTLGIPQQHDGLYTTSLLFVSSDIKVNRLLFENFAFLQNQSTYLSNIPRIFTKNSISYYGKIFKSKMLLKAGLDFRYIISDYLPRYQPINGQFQLQNSKTATSFPLLDARISFKVSSFTTFIKYENLASFFRDDVEFMVLDYAQFDNRFRFGIQWNLWN